MPKFYIGTAGWSYKDWVPSFYPKQQSAKFDFLKFYSAYFNVVEVNSTYYAYVDPKVVQGWIEKVNGIEDFIFTIKLHQDFTHKRNFDNDKITHVNNNLNLLEKEGRLGGLLIQFPYSFSFQQSNFIYLKKLKELFEGFNLFVEVRHKSWFNGEVTDAFKELNLTYCIIDQPLIGSALPFEPVVTNDKIYLRFHGRNTGAWLASINNFGKQQSYTEQNERYSYLYSPGELIEIEMEIEKIIDQVKEVYIIMNNHPKGDAAANAFEMIHYLEKKNKINMPRTIIENYPRLVKFQNS
jgi:uncharacterized protein YecE (DUF72 family)